MAKNQIFKANRTFAFEGRIIKKDAIISDSEWQKLQKSAAKNYIDKVDINADLIGVDINADLKKENADLKKENADLEQQVSSLNEQITSLQANQKGKGGGK